MKVHLRFWFTKAISSLPFRWLIGTAGLAGVGLLVWTFWPLPVEQASFALSSLYLEGGNVTLDWPVIVRRGEAEQITLAVDTAGLQVEVESDDGPVLIPLTDLVPNFNPVFEASLELSGSEITPEGAVRVSFTPGQQAEYVWFATSQSPGLLNGRIWLYLELVPTTIGNEIIVRYPVLARPLEIESRALIGLGVRDARWLGGVLVLVCGWVLWAIWRSKA